MVSSTQIVGTLTHCALIYSMCNFKASQMNLQCSLIWKLIFNELEVDHNAVEATKNICCAKDEDAVNHSAVTRWFKKFCKGCKNFDNQAKSDKPKTMNSEAVF